MREILAAHGDPSTVGAVLAVAAIVVRLANQWRRCTPQHTRVRAHR